MTENRTSSAKSKKRLRESDGSSSPAAVSARAIKSSTTASSSKETAAATPDLSAINSAYGDIDGYAIARDAKRKQRERGVFLDGIQYGEVSPESFATALEWCSPQPNEHFLDIGSGSGKAVLTAAALYDFASSTGVEILQPLHEAALRAHAACPRGSLRCTDVRLVCADAFSMEPPWHEADVVFCTTTCFTDELIEQLEESAAQLRTGARLIVTTRELRHQVAGLRLLRKEKLGYGKGSLLFLAYEKQ